MDLNENIKAMLSPGDETAAGTGYIISRDALTAQMISGEDRDAVKDFRVVDKSGEFTFELSDSWLYVFRTRVAFLCLNLSFNKIETLQAICNPGWAYNPAEFFWNDPMGESHPFSVEKWLSDFLSPLGIQSSSMVNHLICWMPTRIFLLWCRNGLKISSRCGNRYLICIK